MERNICLTKQTVTVDRSMEQGVSAFFSLLFSFHSSKEKKGISKADKSINYSNLYL